MSDEQNEDVNNELNKGDTGYPAPQDMINDLTYSLPKSVDYTKQEAHKKRILKYPDMLTMTDYDKLMLTQQYDKLYNMSKKATKEAEQHKYESRIYNLSINEIAGVMTKTLIDIVNDIVQFINKEDKTMNDFVIIFMSNDRLVYVGIFVVIISFILYFIDLST